MDLCDLHKLVHMVLHFRKRKAMSRKVCHCAGVDAICHFHHFDGIFVLALVCDSAWNHPQCISCNCMLSTKDMHIA